MKTATSKPNGAAAEEHAHSGVAAVTKEAVMKWIHDGHPDQQHDVRPYLIFL
jgi:hypothetical protein